MSGIQRTDQLKETGRQTVSKCVCIFYSFSQLQLKESVKYYLCNVSLFVSTGVYNRLIENLCNSTVDYVLVKTVFVCVHFPNSHYIY